MRTLARAATSSLIMLGAALALVVAAVAVIGIGGTRAATGQGNEIAGDELATAVVTGQLARSMDAAYAAGLAAVQASVPAERARLLGSLYTTLLPAVTDALKRTFAQAMTTQVPLSLLLLDLDHFKQVNDQRGHQVGDQVLANVGATLRNVLRVRDFAGRNGGEEFAVLLPDTSITEALEIAERVRAAVAEISLPGSDVSVTASIGVAVFPDHASTPDRLERLADAALYLAKRQGRNRVELADPSPAPAANGAGPLTEAAHRP
jgi:diguanylate cyclase (GGDEF)-like protein